MGLMFFLFIQHIDLNNLLGHLNNLQKIEECLWRVVGVINK